MCLLRGLSCKIVVGLRHVFMATHNSFGRAKDAICMHMADGPWSIRIWPNCVPAFDGFLAESRPQSCRAASTVSIWLNCISHRRRLGALP